MKKLLLLPMLATGLVFSASAAVKTIPQDVLTWYTDVMKVFTELSKGIDKAKDAKAATTVFQVATKAIGDKNLKARYSALKTKYPDFFVEDSGPDTAGLPAEWVKTMQDYSAAMERYGTGMQKVAAWSDDEGLQQALNDFSEAMNMDSDSSN